MMIDDNDGQMIFEDLGGLKLPDICLTGEEKLVPTGDRTRTRCVTGAYATTWPTAVDIIYKTTTIPIIGIGSPRGMCMQVSKYSQPRL